MSHLVSHWILLGRAGSGKGTLAATLAASHDLAIFETGRELRRVASGASPAAATLRAALAAGGMAPTALVMDILVETLAHPPAGTKGWLLDGIPRRPEQATEVLALRDAGRLPLTGALVLEASETTLTARLGGRLVCRTCQATYHRHFAPPPALTADGGTCACGGALARRLEDTPEGIAERTRLYRSDTEPTIVQLATAGVPVHRVSADGTPAQTFAHAAAILASRGCHPSSGAGVDRHW